MMNRKKAPPRALLTLIFTIVVFIILVVTMIIVGCVIFFLTQIGVLGISQTASAPIHFQIIIFAMTSIVIGTIVAALGSHFPLRPLNTLIEAMNQLAHGKYDIRINLGKHRISQELTDSFNTMAEELENTEMLRTNFINDFSHEFKTPIVSIKGFDKLLQKDNLDQKTHDKYLQIIETESSRLADMATNVLNLNKIEKQTILSNITSFNLSEQIRNCLLLLEKKWSNKNLNLIIDFDEHQIAGNQELLYQVWINLLDNAIKFAPRDGKLGIKIIHNQSDYQILISNNGPKITDEEKKYLYNKFYQGDTSHATEGTGIGLAIVKKIVSLHSGTIDVDSNKNETTFIVTLPLNL